MIASPLTRARTSGSVAGTGLFGSAAAASVTAAGLFSLAGGLRHALDDSATQTSATSAPQDTLNIFVLWTENVQRADDRGLGTLDEGFLEDARAEGGGQLSGVSIDIDERDSLGGIEAAVRLA